MSNEKVKELIIPKGTLIHLNGIPFELLEDIKVLGIESNLKLAMEWKSECKS